MTKINTFNGHDLSVDPNLSPLEIVERKFRGHPDSLADMVALQFGQLYIKNAWDLFPELENKLFPNFSADKVTLSGGSLKWVDGKIQTIKPVNALLIGKITQRIGNIEINTDKLFRESINTIFGKVLGKYDFDSLVKTNHYAAILAGVDHDHGFYNPRDVEELKRILAEETHANDTVYVVAYSPLSTVEKLSIFLDNLTASELFLSRFPEIGSDIKSMIRRRHHRFDITLCLPVKPEINDSLEHYEKVVSDAKQFIHDEVCQYLLNKVPFSEVNIEVNTKDTATKKYFAIWGTALTKGDIGAVGRGNRHQGFISGIRPSTNEAIPGKNPNHFAGILYQLVAEEISQAIFSKTATPNIVYITANNGDSLSNPSSVDIILPQNRTVSQNEIDTIVQYCLSNINHYRAQFITQDIYYSYMKTDQLKN